SLNTMENAMLRRYSVLVLALVFTPTALLAAERPFKARWTGNANLSPTDDPTVLRNDETGEGNATHLGKFQWSSVEYADFDVVPGLPFDGELNGTINY